MTDNRRAIGFLLLGSAFFSVLELLSKQLIAFDQLHPAQLLWVRGILSLIFIPIVFRTPFHRIVRTRHPRKQLMRSALLFAAGMAFFFSLRGVPLADAVAIVFVSPFILTALSAWFLSEQVGIRRWSACAVGFLGCMLIVQPGMEGRNWMYFLPLVDAAASAVYIVLTRLVSRHDSAATSLYYSVMVTVAGTTLLLPWVWQWPGLEAWAMLVALALVANVAHYFHIRAFALGEPSLLAPLSYIHLVFTGVAAWLAFGSVPDWLALVGMAIVVASGLYVLHRETIRRSGPTVPDVPPET